jgi:tetratricopeptide (TPR) repeat protein
MENDKEGVFEYIRKARLDLRNNHLHTYLAVNLGINNQQSDYAKRILLERNTSPDYLSTSAWDLEMGYIAITHLDPDAGKYFEKFINSFKGKFYLKDALQKLSWHHYLQGNQTQADYYRKLTITKGSTLTDADQQALKQARTDKWPDKTLLQARLLNDGGYHTEALRILNGKRISDFKHAEDQLEFAYRVGRIYDDVGRDDEAIGFYKQAIALGESRKEHYAARAALQIGYIFEKNGNKPAAIKWFEKCLKMKEHDFKNSIDQRAKAGIERCND